MEIKGYEISMSKTEFESFKSMHKTFGRLSSSTTDKISKDFTQESTTFFKMFYEYFDKHK